ncbi:MAG: hypothetical protein ACK4N5_13650, partial [Myxococcales bacterium]
MDTSGTDGSAAAPAESDGALHGEADFLAPGLIHEMRQPLLGISAGLQLLGRRAGPELTELDEWTMVRAQLARLEELFRNY